MDRHALRALQHLPCAGRLPFWSDIRLLRDTLAFTREVARRCGPVSYTLLAGQPQVLLLSAASTQAVLQDPQRRFSARDGWTPLLGELFPRGLMLRDGGEHREHRRLMLPALRREMLARHLLRMQAHTEQALDRWAEAPPLRAFDAFKTLTLSMAVDIFLGVRDPAEVRAVNRDFCELVDASTALVRAPLIGRRWARGLAARQRLAAFLHAHAALRRREPGDDLFSQLCLATDEDGRRFSDAEVVDHLIFLLMAAHDTTTSALTSVCWLLAQSPEWQARLRDEARALPDRPDAPGIPALNSLTAHSWVIREALRLLPPVPMLLRRATASFEAEGYTVPAGAMVCVFPLHVQRDPAAWAQPDAFDPGRHDLGQQSATGADERAGPRSGNAAWMPFGGGAHMCLGLHFADLQLRQVLSALLRRFSWQLPARYSPSLRHAPIVHPRDGLRLQWHPLRTDSPNSPGSLG